MCYLHLPAKPDPLPNETSWHDAFMLRLVNQLKETRCFKCTITTLLFDAECRIREVQFILQKVDQQLRNHPAIQSNGIRSEERSVGTEGVSKCRSRWTQYDTKKTK